MASKPMDYKSLVFDDDKEKRKIFSNPSDNVARYLYLGRVDLLKSLINGNPDLAVDNIIILYFSDVDVYELNPVQFILKSHNFSNEEKLFLLGFLAKEKSYFANAAANGEADLRPLSLALSTGDKNIFQLVANSGGDIKSGPGPKGSAFIP